jgi:hypothetical protein
MNLDSFLSAIDKKLPPAPEAELARFENLLGSRLPEDYRQFLVACNGGYVGGALWFKGPTSRGEPADAGVHHIGGFRREYAFSLEQRRDVFAGRIPDDLLWIMDDPFGNAICLGIRGEYYGMVFFWDHEREPDEDWNGAVETAGNLQQLADGFTEFIAGLKKTEPAAQPAGGMEVRDTGIVKPDSGPEGLGGWLILVCIGLFVSAGRILFQLHQTFVPIFLDGTWLLLTTPASENYHPLWMPLLLFEIAWNVCSFLLVIYLIGLFFKKSSRFPAIYIVLLSLGAPFILVDAWLLTWILPDEPMLDPDSAKELFRSIVGLLIWVPYMVVSKRVKNTFVS